MSNFTAKFNDLITKIENNFIWVKNQLTSQNTAISGKASSSDLTTHAGNTTVHITSSERTTWNNKQNAISATNKISADYIIDGTTNKVVSATEKSAWNAKADSSDLTAHTENTDIHITATERTNWNAKVDSSTLSSHTGNTTVHITATERSTWNGKQNALSSTQLANIAAVPNKANISDVPTKLSDLTDDLDVASKSYVDSKVLSGVRHQGSIAFASLPALTEANINKCYNITDAFTTTSDFLEGAGHDYPAGTNVMIVESGNSYKYDAKAGWYDLSVYCQTSALDTELTNMFNTGAGNITDLTATT